LDPLDITNVFNYPIIQMKPPFQLISYIAPSAPARRARASGPLLYLRAEIGFTPAWFGHLGIDFGEPWHEDPDYRRDSVLRMRDCLQKRFPGFGMGMLPEFGEAPDLLTGVYGSCLVASLYGATIQYGPNRWPQSKPINLSSTQIDELRPPVLKSHPFFQKLLRQIDWIVKKEGKLAGYLNWQGILNNAHRLRGQQLFIDMIESPDRCIHLFECVYETMAEAFRSIQEIRHSLGQTSKFFTTSNCLVNLISPDLYSKLLLQFDQRLAQEFGCLGLHNCAWNADPYLESYSRIPYLGYIDMGVESDLGRAREMFLHARRAVMVNPDNIEFASDSGLAEFLGRIAEQFGPCDVILADIDRDMDEALIRFLNTCKQISEMKNLDSGI
jgi:hypothetical protein